MGQADLSYLAQLFTIADSLTSEDDQEQLSFGLGEIAPDSSLAKDDEGTNGYWVSTVVTHSIGAALDHVITLRMLVKQGGSVTIAAPWTILRGVVEPAALAVWTLNGRMRQQRQERALRVWHHDMTERGKWEDDTGYKITSSRAKHGKARAVQMVEIAKSLGLRPNQVSAQLNYGDVVAEAGEVVGWDRKLARARWRESSGFAHGRTWPLLRLSEFEAAERIRGGVALTVTLAEDHHRELARLATDLVERAIDDYARAAASPDDRAVHDH